MSPKNFNPSAAPTQFDGRMLGMHHIIWEETPAGGPGWLLKQIEKLTRELGESMRIQAQLRQERDAWRWRCKLAFAALLAMVVIVGVSDIIVAAAGVALILGTSRKWWVDALVWLLALPLRLRAWWWRRKRRRRAK